MFIIELEKRCFPVHEAFNIIFAYCNVDGAGDRIEGRIFVPA